MTRTYSSLTTQSDQICLNTLIDPATSVDRYREAMFALGVSLGEAILGRLKDINCNIYLACTVEDADFLAKGILKKLEHHSASLAFACFWNQRLSPFEIEDLQIAPIIKKYQEPHHTTVNYLVVVKSIISGACVVRTNLMHLIQTIDPDSIFIAAPVIYDSAEDSLKQSFASSIYNKFEFFYFARDDERTAAGEVVPGIGGMIYDRLGFSGQDDKNSYVPEIVKSRRTKMISA
jgi:hypothetical protein